MIDKKRPIIRAKEIKIKLYTISHLQERGVQTIKQLFDLICDHEIDLETKIYDHSHGQWVTPKDNEVLILCLGILNPNLKLQINSHDGEQPPPVPLPSPTTYFNQEDKIRALEDERELVIKALYQLSSKKSIASDEKLLELKELIKDMKQKENLYKERLKKLLKDQEENQGTVFKLKEIGIKYKKLASELQNTIAIEKGKNKILQRDYEEVKSKYDDLKKQYSSKETLETYMDDMDESSLKLDISANEGLKRHSAKMIKNLDPSRDQKEGLTDQELERLTGELFEISNTPQWYYRDGQEEVGPCTFEEITKLLEGRELERKNLIRRNKESWKSIESTYEFSAPYKFHLKEVDDDLVKTYYLKRESVRVPFYELMTIVNEGHTIRGHCTSLSVGGCFMELSKKELDQLQKGEMVKFELNSLTLSYDLKATAKIVNKSEARPRGIGLQFQEITDQDKEVIKKYVNSCLDQDKQKKAA